MRQSIRAEVINELKEYHRYLRKMFNEGKLKGKITSMMKVKCDEKKVSFRSYWRLMKLL